jgi:peptide/nickel transport system substrate-binding protein
MRIGARGVWYVLLGIVPASVSLSACSRPPSAPVQKAVLSIGASLPTEVSGGLGLPVLASSYVDESLVSIGNDGRATEKLARSWTWTDQGRTLRVTLTPNVKFHDGTPLTASLVASILRARAHQGGLSYRSVQSVEATGPDTFEFRLSEPESFLLTDLAGASVVLPQNPDIGTGPFRRVSSKPYFVLQAFDGYHRGRPAIDELHVRGYQSLRAAWAAMMRGEIDAVHEVSREAADFVDAETTVRTYPFLRPYYIALAFNLRHRALSQRGVRQALNEAVDKDVIVRIGLQGRARPADSPIWPDHWAYSGGVRKYSFSPGTARLRLDVSGFPLPKTTLTSPTSMPSRFKFTCMVWAEDARFERVALVIQKQLFDVGVDMKLEPVTMDQLASRAATGNFDAFLMEMGSIRSLAYVYRFWHSPQGQPIVDSGYRSADAILDRIRHATSEDETRAATAELQRILYDDPPAIFVAWLQATRAVSSRFSVPAEPDRDVMSTVADWRPTAPLLRAAK